MVSSLPWVKGGGCYYSSSRKLCRDASNVSHGIVECVSCARATPDSLPPEAIAAEVAEDACDGEHLPEHTGATSIGGERCLHPTLVSDKELLRVLLTCVGCVVGHFVKGGGVNQDHNFKPPGVFPA